MQSVALREAIKEYEANKWKVIGQKVGKPAKVSPKPFPLLSGRQHVLNWSCKHANNMQRNISGMSEACWWNLTKWWSLCIGYLLPPPLFAPISSLWTRTWLFLEARPHNGVFWWQFGWYTMGDIWSWVCELSFGVSLICSQFFLIILPVSFLIASSSIDVTSYICIRHSGL